MAYRYAKRQKRTDVPNATTATAAPKVGGGVPNSALLASMGYHDGGGSPDLQAAMEQKRRSVVGFDREASEAEADKLSEGVKGETPEAVKREMGQRLGADFSGVRFHEDAQSAERAESMGANAWAQGGDVYFGARGFDPSVAAHELVHTVQQGAAGPVAAMSPVAQSAPMGAVQMDVETAAEKKALEDADKFFKIRTGMNAEGYGQQNLVSKEDREWYEKNLMNMSPELIAELQRRHAQASKDLVEYRKGIPDARFQHRLPNDYKAMASDEGLEYQTYFDLVNDGFGKTRQDYEKGKKLYASKLTEEQLDEAKEIQHQAARISSSEAFMGYLEAPEIPAHNESKGTRGADIYNNFDAYQKARKNPLSDWVDIEDDEMKEIANAFQDANGGNLGGLGGGLMKSNAIRLKKKK